MRMFYIVDDHGERLGKYRTREEAVEAWFRLCADDAEANEDTAVLEFDANGKRVGEIISHSHAV
jgi:hypothetical protein